MRGIRFSMLIALPFILGALHTAYNLIYLEKEFYLFYFLGFLTILIALYFASSEINYWYNKKFPPKLDPPIIAWLHKFFPFYISLNENDREKFEIRLALYLEARSFHLMLADKKEIPEDFKAIIAAHGIRMTLGLDDFLIGEFDRIICYNHPFPSPQHQFLHTVETHFEDGVILLSIEQLMMGVGKPDQFYNIGYHAYAEALIFQFPALKNLDDSNDRNKLTQILKFSTNEISQFTGFQSLDINVVSLATFFTQHEAFQMNWPEQFAHYKSILNYEY